MQSTLAMAGRKCVICEWRRHRIGGQSEPQPCDGEAPLDECDSESLAIRRLLHTYPGPTWTAIIDTGMLSHCSTPMPRNSSLWVCIPLRMPEQHRWLERANSYWDFEGRTFSSNDCVVAYHSCLIQSSVASTNCWGIWVGRGILVDGRLRYGYCSPTKKSEVVHGWQLRDL